MPRTESTMTKRDDRVVVCTSLHTLLVVHNNLILALRQPGNHGPSADIAAEFTEQIGKQMVTEGFVTNDELGGTLCECF